MNRNNLRLNISNVAAVVGIVLAMHGKANLEFGFSIWIHLAVEHKAAAVNLIG